MTSHRVLVGALKAESNTFVPFSVAKRDFREGLYYAEGDDILTFFEGKGLEISGFLDQIGSAGWEIVPAVATEAVPSGPIEHSILNWFVDKCLDAIERRRSVQAVLLALHGATISDESDDACGDILTAIRGRVGPDVFIGATLDLHANITGKMVQAANVLYGFHTYPHVDQYEVGFHVARLAVLWVHEGLKPITRFCKVPMLISPTAQLTEEVPFADLIYAANEMESHPEILAASLFPCQPWLDIEELGFASVVVGTGDTDLAQRQANRLGQLAWSKRHEFVPTLPFVEEALEQAAQVSGGPIVLADLGDGPGGGAGGDSAVILRVLLNLPAGSRSPALLTITDPEAVDTAMAAGIGQEITVEVGGRISRGFFEPIEVTGFVKYLGTPIYGAYKAQTSMGPAAVLSVHGIDIVLTRKAILTATPDPYEAVGLDPRTAKIVVVKSGAQFRQYYEPFAKDIILVNTPGPTTSQFGSLPYRSLQHPIFPWEDWEWTPWPDERGDQCLL